jgi:glycosyltransferase domain-containing protein
MLTVIVPTMNRSDFLARLLNYYADAGYQHWITIGDSSQGAHLETAKKTVAGLKGRLKINYCEYPGLSEPECTNQLLQSVKTPYLAWVADDDFLVPSALEQCVEFLRDHPDYSVALGKAVLFDLGRSGPFGDITNVSPYMLRSIEAASGRERLLYHLSHYSNPNFGVHRTDEFQKAYAGVPALGDKSFTEILPNCMSAVQGKVKELDCFYLVRQGHDRRYLLPDTFDWLTGQKWLPSYQIFNDSLAEELVRVDGIEDEAARDVVKQAFWAYLANNLLIKYHGRYEQSISGHRSGFLVRARKAMKQGSAASKVIKPVWRLFKSRMNPSGMYLPTLLRDSSPYHQDFMRVYRAVKRS